jgi:hypothetical protein
MIWTFIRIICAVLMIAAEFFVISLVAAALWANYVSGAL